MSSSQTSDLEQANVFIFHIGCALFFYLEQKKKKKSSKENIKLERIKTNTNFILLTGARYREERQNILHLWTSL